MVMASLLRDPEIDDFDIIAIQEPWTNPYTATTHHPAKDRFHLCYPTGDAEGSARVCFFINKRMDQTKWRFEEQTKYMCSVVVEPSNERQEEGRLVIHNIYNPPRNRRDRRSTLPKAREALARHQAAEQILLGDFNLHHPLWGGLGRRETDPEAEDLIDIIGDFALHNTLPPGTITFEEGRVQSAIDLCYVTTGLIDRIIKSEVNRNLDHDSDHLPISTALDLTVQRLEEKPRKAWKRLDEKAYMKALKRSLPPLRRPLTKTALDTYTSEVAAAIQDAISKAVPETFPSCYSREGWTEECAAVLAETKRLKRAHNQHHTEETWEAYRAARNHKARTVSKALRKAHRDRIERAAESPQTFWKLAKWARTRHNQSARTTPAIRHPTTQQELIDPADKAELFRDVFFPTPPEADLEDIENAEYSGQIETPPIEEKEVRNAIRAASPLKAPGPDGITNKALQAGVDLIAAHLTRMFNQSLKLGYCPSAFRASITAVLRKPDKANYAVPKAYRPIALLNTIGKIMDAVIARRLSYLVETHHVLPPQHMGGRKQRSTEHALHAVAAKICDTWNQGTRGQVTSLLLLDVSGAFDNVSHIRLLHNLRKRKVDEKTVRWIASFLSERHTHIVVDGVKSEQYAINTGIPQGSPLSPILYLFYNADLVEQCNETDTMSTGYIDDVAIMAWGDTTERTCQTLSTILQKAQRWASKHASVFAPDKFQLTHFTRAWKSIDTDAPIHTEWGEIKPATTCKYLGLTMDSKLKWREHVETIKQKATRTVHTLNSLGSSTWGIRLQDMRKLYEAIVLPQMMYGCSIWSNANLHEGSRTYTHKTIDALRSIQARAARSICGAYKATAMAALDVEAFLLPVEQQIWRRNADVITRLSSCREIAKTAGFELNEPVPVVAKRNRRPRKSPWWKINEELRSKQVRDLEKQEPIPPFITPPWRRGPRTYIDDNAEKARDRHDKECATDKSLSIYTDGSGIEGEIGSAAVCPLTKQTRSVHMGSDTLSTVYAAELQGISLALHIAKEYADGDGERKDIAVYTDNQAAIWSIAKAEGRSGAYILADIAQQVQELQNKGLSVTVRWIPAHVGIEGNEAADQAAKEATGWREDGRSQQPAEPPPQLYPLRTTLRRWCKTQAERQWISAWREDKKGRTTYRHTPTPTKKVLQLHERLSKRESALLVQLRTEKIGLNDFLFKRHVPDIPSPGCDCGERRQTVAHVLLRCSKYKDLRNRIFANLSGRNSLRTILSTPQLATKAIEYMEQTQILGQVGIRDT
jgi:ribonuclease HI/exonuclease III